MENKEHAVKTVIGGSYRKHLREMLKLKDYLIEKGIAVQAPTGAAPTNPGEEFILLDSDPIEDPRVLQDSIFSMMRNSAFHIILNKEGYIGKAAMLEFGYAVALGIQVLSVEPISDPNLAIYSRYIGDLFPDWERRKSEILGENVERYQKRKLESYREHF